MILSHPVNKKSGSQKQQGRNQPQLNNDQIKLFWFRFGFFSKPIHWK